MSVNAPDFDVSSAHRYFSAHCFNRAWDLMEKSERTPAEDQEMVALNQASIYHWLQRPDCTDKNRSIGFWQASRIAAVLENAGEARRFGEMCRGYSNDLPPFYRAYAHEALARAAALIQDKVTATHHLTEAHTLAVEVEDAEARHRLLSDLATLSR
jgi:hypothetical protein